MTTTMTMVLRPNTAAAPEFGRIVLAGAISVAVFLGGFGLWTATASLDAAAVAQGQITVESRRKTVQHLEGGIVREILVSEGTRVDAGTPLVRLDATRPGSTFEALRAQHDELAAREARLMAERAGASDIRYPKDLMERASDPRVGPLLDGQRRLFSARRDSLGGQADILVQRAAQLDAEGVGLRAQATSADRQLGFIADELAGVRGLVNGGLERRSRLLALEREAANIEGRRGEYLASIARLAQRRGETELQILDLRNRRAEEVAGELREVQAGLGELAERLRAAEDVMDRTVIRASTGGVVMNVRMRTPGGVIGAGEAILDIVPTDERLFVEVAVRPTDIDSVHVGLPARVRLPAFKKNTTPMIEGRVSYVAADALADPNTHTASYTAHVTLDRAMLDRAGGLTLHPGMPAEVIIVTGERTPLEYLMRPLLDSFARAFREE